MKSLKLVAVVSAVLLSPLAPSTAWASGDHNDKHHAKPAVEKTAGDVTNTANATNATNAASMADGEVRKIDKDAKKITLKHGEIKNLEMPAMTMVFQVKDAALLDKVKVGDKVKFNAEKVSSGYAVSVIEVAK